MFGSIQSSPSAIEGQNIYTDKSHPGNNKFWDSCHAVINESMELKAREKEMSLYQMAINTNKIKNIPALNGSTDQNDRFHSLGMAVTNVANVDIINMINNAYPYLKVTVDAQTEKTVNEICDNAPRDKNVDIFKDNAINNREKAFISGFLDYQSPIDTTHYTTGLEIGYSNKDSILDPSMIGHLQPNGELARKYQSP